MFATTKKKRAFLLTILISLIAIVFAGVGLGVYFLVKDNTSMTLAKRQAVFGRAVNSSVKKPEEVEFDISLLPSGVDATNIVGFSDKYFIIKRTSGIYVVYNRQTSSFVVDMANYDSIDAIYGSIVILSSGGQKSLYNLDAKKSVAQITNISLVYDNGYLLLTSNDANRISVYENGVALNNIFACVINTTSGEIVFKADSQSRLINISLSHGILIANHLDCTKVYLAGSEFKQSIQFDNEFDEAASEYNVLSLIENKNYYISNYYRVFALNENLLLVENSKIVQSSDYDVVGQLTNGERRNYQNTYTVIDLARNIQFKLEDNGQIIEPIDVNVGKDYFAVIKIPVDKKQTILNDAKIISYYTIAKEKKAYKLVELVEYDYWSYGHVVGYNGKGLFTSGGAKSSYIDFDGNVKEFDALKENNTKITQTTYNDVVVVSSLLGEKRLYYKNSEPLTTRFFTQVSPFINGGAIGIASDQYYLVSNSGLIKSINDFAEEYAEYVFMGIGYFFVESGENYKVYNFAGDLLYENVDIEISYNENTHKVTLAIVGDNIAKNLSITPIEDVLTTKNIIEKFENYVAPKTFVESPKQATIDEEIRVDRTVTFSTSSVNNNEGGRETRSFQVGFDNLDALTFRSYSSLNSKEVCMIPGFNQGATNQYIYKIPADISNDNREHNLIFEGVYFVADSEGYATLAVIRLQENGFTYYMMTLAVKESYLTSLYVEPKKSDGTSSLSYFYDYKDSSIRAVNGALFRDDSLAFSYDEMKNNLVAVTPFDASRPDQTPYTPSGQDIVITPRQVDLKSAGFDGGFVFTTDEAKSMKISFMISNTYLHSGGSSKVLSRGQTKDCGKYTVSYSGSSVTVTAKEGYFITYFNVVGSSKADSSYTNISSGILLSVMNDVVSSVTISGVSYSYIQLKSVDVVESFSYVNLIRYNKVIQEKQDEYGNVIMDEEDEEPILEVVELEEFEEIEILYYYYGFGYDIRIERNPARMGFENFRRKTSIEVPEKDGYTFKNYSYVEIEEKNIRIPVQELINDKGEMIVIPGTDAVEGEEKYYADAFLIPDGEGPQTHYLEAIYEANEYIIYYYMDKHNYNNGTNPLYDSNDALTREQIITEVKYYDYVEELHDITLDDYNLDNNYVPTSPDCIYRGYDFLGWFYVDEDTGEELEFENGDIYTFVKNLRLFAKWKAQVYTLEFDANVGDEGAYQGVMVGGYEYSIDEAVFKSNYKYINKEDTSLNLDIKKGTIFDQENKISKKITYGGMYGSLPELVGRTEVEQNIYEEYIFLGWYLHGKLLPSYDSYEDLVMGKDKDGNDIIKLDSSKSVNIIPPIVNEETGERKLTIYAHYRRVVYSYKLSATVDSKALDNNNQEIDFAKKYTVDASTAKGVKAQYSTDGYYNSYNSASAYENQECNIWSLQDITNPVYTFYGVQGEEVKVNAFVGEGYYISAVVIKIPDYEDSFITTIKRGEWSSEDQFVFAFADGVETSNSVAGYGYGDYFSRGFDIQITLREFYAAMAEFNAVNPVCAEIELQFTSMKFKNEFTISNADGENDGDGRITNTDGETLVKQENIIYGYTNSYRAASGKTPVTNNVANSYLSKLKFDDEVIATLNYEYGSESVSGDISTVPIFYHKVYLEGKTAVDSFWTKGDDGVIYKTSLYNLVYEDESGIVIVSLKVIYNYMRLDTILNYYIYEFSIKSKADHEIEACFTDIRSVVEFKLYDVDYSTVDNGLISNEDNLAIDKRVNISVQSGDKNYNGHYTRDEDTISPNQNIRYNIVPKENYFISSISISYNGSDRYIVAYPTMGINNDGGSINIFQTAGYLEYGNSSPLSRGESVVLFKSTNVTISWLSGRGFAVLINQIRHDITISVTMLEYQLVQVQTPGETDTTFEITEELARAKTNALPQNVAISKGIYYYTEVGVEGTSQGLKTYCNWVIAGELDDVTEIFVKPKISGKISYKIRSVIPSGAPDVVKVEEGIAYYNTTNRTIENKVSVELTVDSAGLLVNSYLGRGTVSMDSILDSGIKPKASNETETGHIYTLDSNTFMFGKNQGPFSDIFAVYGDPITAEERTKVYDDAFINVSFTGGTIKVYVNEVDGYKLSSMIVELYIIEEGTGDVGDASRVYTLLPDAVSISKNSGTTYIEITIPKLNNSQYELRLFQKPIEYELVYDNATSAGDKNPALGVVEKTKHLFNVPSTIRTDSCYSKVGYTAIGYSKNKKTGNNLSEKDCDFLLPGFADPEDKNKSSTINENLWTGVESDADKTVVLYTVYKANEYNIIYNANDNTVGNGSSPAETSSEGASKVIFDSTFGTLRGIDRFGYTFKGWYTLPSGGVKVGETRTLDIDLFEQIKNPDDDKSVVLYAQYEAKTFIINLDLNDLANRNGTSNADLVYGSMAQVLTFDDMSDPFIYPEIERIGYNYKGLRYERTFAAEAKGLTLADYLTSTEFNWNFMVSGGFGEELIKQINNRQIMTVYATYTPMTFKYYINLNNTQMANYGAQVTVSYNAKSYVETDHYVNGLEISIDFDSKFGTMPTVSMDGYDVIGLFSKKGSNEIGNNDGLVLASDPFDINLFEKLMYTNESNVDTSLQTLYDKGECKFSLYVHYVVKQIEFSVSGVSSSIVNVVDNINGYIVSNGAPFMNGGSSTVGDYGCDGIIDILPSAGKYFSSLIISYSKNGVAGQIAITFDFDNANKTLSAKVNGASISLSSSFTRLNGSYDGVANGMYIKATGYQQYTDTLETFRIILGFDYTLEDIEVKAEEVSQMFKVTFKIPTTSGGWATYQEKSVAYGSANFTYGITTPTLTGKVFTYWSLDMSGSSMLTSSYIIEENTIIYAYFRDESASSSISFWIWNPVDNAYELVEQISHSGKFTGTMPSPSSESWPSSSAYFSGWQVRFSKPSSPLYYETGNFNNNYVINGNIDVYACYYTKGFTEPSFSITKSTSTSSPLLIDSDRSSTKSYTLSDVGKEVYDYYDYRKTVYFDVNISTVDLYKFEYNSSYSGEEDYAPVRRYDYVTYVAWLDGSYSNVETAIYNARSIISSTRGTRRVRIDSYTYSYTETYKYRIVEKTRVYQKDIKDEEGNVIGQEPIEEKYAAAEFVNYTSDERSKKIEAYNDLDIKVYYFLAFLTPRAESDYESFKYGSYPSFFSVTFPAP